MFFFLLGIHKLKSSLPPRDPKSVRSQPFDPIPPVAKQISSKWWLLCFDEFQVIYNDMYVSFSNCIVLFQGKVIGAPRLLPKENFKEPFGLPNCKLYNNDNNNVIIIE